MSGAEGHVVSLAVGVLVVALLYRRITAIGKLTVVLWAGMLVTVLWIVIGGVAHFQRAVAFDFPPGAFTFSRGFLSGLGSAMLIAMYDLMGYYDVSLRGRRSAPAGSAPFRARLSARCW